MTKLQNYAVLALAAATLFGATGCIKTQITALPGGIIAANKPVEQGKYTVLNGGRVVTGSYKVDLLKGGAVKESCMKQAVDQALAQCPSADALVGITTDSQSVTKLMVWPLPLFFENSYTVFVTGTPVKLNQ